VSKKRKKSREVDGVVLLDSTEDESSDCDRDLKRVKRMDTEVFDLSDSDGMNSFHFYCF
jgi:hypothetical protein